MIDLFEKKKIVPPVYLIVYISFKFINYIFTEAINLVFLLYSFFFQVNVVIKEKQVNRDLQKSVRWRSGAAVRSKAVSHFSMVADSFDQIKGK